MKVEQNIFTSNIYLNKTNAPFAPPTSSRVYVTSTYFTDIIDNTVINIKKSGLLCIKNCVFIKCINNSDEQHVINYEAKQSIFIFTHCLSEYCYSQTKVFYSELNESNNLKSEISLCNFEKNDPNYQPLKGYFVIFGGKIKISNANFTKIKVFSDILYFGTSDVESYLSFTSFSENVVTDHSVVAMKGSYFSIFCSNFLDLSNILFAVHFLTGNTVTISTSNFAKVTSNEIFCNGEAKYIYLINCFIDGIKPTTSKIIIYKDKNALIEVSPEVFPPFDAFLCSRALKNKKHEILCCFLALSLFMLSSMGAEIGKIF